MAIKKYDFIEVDYTGKTKESGFVFDTTQESVAKEAGIHNPQAKYGPAVICVGKHHILSGIDKNVEGKEPGTYTFELSPEEAFGKKNAKMIQLIPTNKFTKENIQPQVGLQVNIDGHIGVIKTVTGGRTLVDFNHPLSGKDVTYDVTINKIVTDKKEQVQALLKMTLGVADIPVLVEGDKATITFKQELPDPIKEQFNKEIAETTGLKELVWTTGSEEKKEAKKETKPESSNEQTSQ